MYCGARTSLTVDHVIPRSKGGTSGWDNIVASCAPCNRRKGDRLPHQVDMHPRVKPRIPSPTSSSSSRRRRSGDWKQYLLHEAARDGPGNAKGPVSSGALRLLTCWTYRSRSAV